MKPRDVIETEDQEPVPTQRLTTWTRRGVSVSFHPSPDPKIRAQQEADLTRHLDEKEKAIDLEKATEGEVLMADRFLPSGRQFFMT